MLSSSAGLWLSRLLPLLAAVHHAGATRLLMNSTAGKIAAPGAARRQACEDQIAAITHLQLPKVQTTKIIQMDCQKRYQCSKKNCQEVSRLAQAGQVQAACRLAIPRPRAPDMAAFCEAMAAKVLAAGLFGDALEEAASDLCVMELPGQSLTSRARQGCHLFGHRIAQARSSPEATVEPDSFCASLTGGKAKHGHNATQIAKVTPVVSKPASVPQDKPEPAVQKPAAAVATSKPVQAGVPKSSPSDLSLGDEDAFVHKVETTSVSALKSARKAPAKVSTTKGPFADDMDLMSDDDDFAQVASTTPQSPKHVHAKHAGVASSTAPAHPEAQRQKVSVTTTSAPDDLDLSLSGAAEVATTSARPQLHALKQKKKKAAAAAADASGDLDLSMDDSDEAATTSAHPQLHTIKQKKMEKKVATTPAAPSSDLDLSMDDSDEAVTTSAHPQLHAIKQKKKKEKKVATTSAAPGSDLDLSMDDSDEAVTTSAHPQLHAINQKKKEKKVATTSAAPSSDLDLSMDDSDEAVTTSAHPQLHAIKQKKKEKKVAKTSAAPSSDLDLSMDDSDEFHAVKQRQRAKDRKKATTTPAAPSSDLDLSMDDSDEAVTTSAHPQLHAVKQKKDKKVATTSAAPSGDLDLSMDDSDEAATTSAHPQLHAIEQKEKEAATTSAAPSGDLDMSMDDADEAVTASAHPQLHAVKQKKEKKVTTTMPPTAADADLSMDDPDGVSETPVAAGNSKQTPKAPKLRGKQVQKAHLKEHPTAAAPKAPAAPPRKHVAKVTATAAPAGGDLLEDQSLGDASDTDQAVDATEEGGDADLLPTASKPAAKKAASKPAKHTASKPAATGHTPALRATPKAGPAHVKMVANTHVPAHQGKLTTTPALMEAVTSPDVDVVDQAPSADSAAVVPVTRVAPVATASATTPAPLAAQITAAVATTTTPEPPQAPVAPAKPAKVAASKAKAADGDGGSEVNNFLDGFLGQYDDDAEPAATSKHSKEVHQKAAKLFGDMGSSPPPPSVLQEASGDAPGGSAEAPQTASQTSLLDTSSGSGLDANSGDFLNDFMAGDYGDDEAVPAGKAKAAAHTAAPALVSGSAPARTGAKRAAHTAAPGQAPPRAGRPAARPAAPKAAHSAQAAPPATSLMEDGDHDAIDDTVTAFLADGSDGSR